MQVTPFLVSTRKISFYNHINAAIFKAKKGLGIIKSLLNIFPRNSLLTIYKSFIRPNLDYCDFIYEQQWVDDSFCIEFERTHNNAALAITVAKKVTSQTKLGKEMVRVSLKFGRCFRQLCTLFKINTNAKPEYPLILIPTVQRFCNTRSLYQVENYHCRTDTFKDSFFPYTIIEGTKWI